MKTIVAFLLFCLFGSFSTNVTASDSQSYRIQLYDKNNKITDLGQLVLTPVGEEWNFSVHFNKDLFVEEFLNMAPFNCLYEGDNGYCHLPYLYPINRTISKTDLVDLDYSLMFIQRKKLSLGIDPYKGRYFKFQWDGDDLVGELMETDLHIMQVPPPAGEMRPLTDYDLHEADMERHFFTKILISPETV